MFALLSPTVDLHQQWLEAHREWGSGAHEDGFGLDPSDDVESPSGFAAWVESLQQQSDPLQDRRGTCRWIVEGNRVLGGIALRHGTARMMSPGGMATSATASVRRRAVVGSPLGRWARC